MRSERVLDQLRLLALFDGDQGGRKIEITSGLQGGETVVIEGNFSLGDGTKVEVAEDKNDEAPAGEKKPEEK